MKVLLTPDICRHILLQQDEFALGLLQSWTERGDEILLSAISYAELIAGALQTADREKHMKLVNAFCERLDAIVPWDDEAINQYTHIQLQAMESGKLTNMNNAMLAAHAISLNASLLCMNKLNFADIEGLQLIALQDAAD